MQISEMTRHATVPFTGERTTHMSEPSLTANPDSLALHSGDYVARYKRKSLHRMRNLAALMAIPDDAEVADFACGNGMLLQVLGDRSGAYHGIDFSADFVATAREWAEESGLHNGFFHCADIVDFSARHPQAFDIATTMDFSEHVDDPAALNIYSAIRRSLKPGGRLYLHTPNLDFFLERAKDSGILRQFPEHVAVRTPEGMVDLLVRAGFAREAIKVSYIAHYNILKLVHPLSYLSGIGRYFRARLWIEARA